MPKKSKRVDELACSLCKDLERMTIDEFKEHRTLVHEDKEPGKLKMQTIMHLDGTDFFASTYEIIDADKKVVGYRYTSNPRSRESKEIWR